MSKYIIEIAEEYEEYFKGVLICGIADGKFAVDVIAREDLEELNSDYINEHFGELQDEAYQRGHDDGYEAGCATAFKPVSDAEYQRGLNDAWEAARRIMCDDGIDMNTLCTIFRRGCSDSIIKDYSASEAIAKLKAYEDKHSDRIEVGDEVISLRKNGEVIEDISPWIVTYETKYAYQGFDACGMFHNNPKESVRKTGKHYDIQSILEAMRTHD